MAWCHLLQRSYRLNTICALNPKLECLPAAQRIPSSGKKKKKSTSEETTTLPCTAQRQNSFSAQRISLDAPNQPHGAWYKCQNGFLPHPKAEHQLCSPSTGSASIPWHRPAAAACTPQLHACHPCHEPSEWPWVSNPTRWLQFSQGFDSWALLFFTVFCFSVFISCHWEASVLHTYTMCSVHVHEQKSLYHHF